MKTVNDATFHEEVRENIEPTVVYFTGSWCQPCKNFGPIVEDMAKRMEGDVRFLKADMDKTSQAAQELNIRSLPSLVLFNDGMVREIHAGTMKLNELRLWIQENI